MFKNLFNRKFIVCPRCVAEVRVRDEGRTCSECGFAIPVQYVQDYNDFKPIFISIFGWRQVGKTMFLDVLRLHLYDLGLVWHSQGYGFFPVGKIDFDHQSMLRSQRSNGQPPNSTQARSRDQNEVYIMKLSNMDRWSNRHLIMMDHAGERFQEFGDFPSEEVPFLKATPTTVMLISLPDLMANNTGEQMDQLLQIYINALREMGVKFDKERRKLVVVFTKADKIRGLPASLQNYVSYDEFWDRIDGDNGANAEVVPTPEYIERMGRVSKEIERWLGTNNRVTPGGAAFLGLIRSHNIEARYSMITASGRDIDGGNVGQFRINPRRVLDPFFWALEFQSQSQ
ncbi:MAG: hypothetical protein SGJ24_20005 [Chloroflexota bacterium]|nr:hypothetical protein [Chloroflexota bacterium]